MNDVSDSESTGLEKVEVGLADVYDDVFIGLDRLSCVAHTLQLCIKDGLKDVSAIEKVIEHVARQVATAHRSYLVRDRLDLINVFLPQRNQTRWNSQFNMVKSFLKLSTDELSSVFETENVLTLTQRNILEELIMVLEDFSVATELIQKEDFFYRSCFTNV